MRAASCFSGIGAAELALLDADWLWSAEVDPFANAVREQRLNDNNLGDALASDFIERARSFGPLALLIGGPPCQDFSSAGLRAGLDGDRGNLSLRWVQIINALRPRYAVTENVPGWLSVNRGHAFGAFLAGLVGHDTALLPPKECGGRWTDAGMVDGPDGRLCWRTLDAQFFGLAQRRRRVFVVFCPRDGGDPAQVLLERKGVQGHPAPSREAGKTTAPTLASRASAGGGLGTDFDCDGGLIAASLRGNSWCDNAGDESKLIAHSLRADGFDASEDGTGRGTPLVRVYDDPRRFDARGIHGGGDHGDLHPPLNTVYSQQLLAFDARQSDTITYGDMSGPLDTDGHSVAVQCASTVRRLTPAECEKLQGFPPSWTDVVYRGKAAADGPRYKALGNAFAINCVRWIAKRLVAEDAASARPGVLAA